MGEPAVSIELSAAERWEIEALARARIVLATANWLLRSMARAVGYAPSTIHRIGRAFGLQPHRSETFKFSTDPLFVD